MYTGRRARINSRSGLMSSPRASSVRCRGGEMRVAVLSAQAVQPPPHPGVLLRAGLISPGCTS